MVLSSLLANLELWWAEEGALQLAWTFIHLLPPQSCGDSSPDAFSDGLSSSTLPDDHSSYTVQSYLGQDLDVERALTPGEGMLWGI